MELIIARGSGGELIIGESAADGSPQFAMINSFGLRRQTATDSVRHFSR